MPDDLNDQNLSELASSISAHDLNSMSQALTVSVLNSALDINTQNASTPSRAGRAGGVPRLPAAHMNGQVIGNGPVQTGGGGAVRPGQPVTFPILQGQLLHGQLVPPPPGPLMQGSLTPVTPQRPGNQVLQSPLATQRPPTGLLQGPPNAVVQGSVVQSVRSTSAPIMAQQQQGSTGIRTARPAVPPPGGNAPRAAPSTGGIVQNLLQSPPLVSPPPVTHQHRPNILQSSRLATNHATQSFQIQGHSIQAQDSSPSRRPPGPVPGQQGQGQSEGHSAPGSQQQQRPQKGNQGRQQGPSPQQNQLQIQMPSAIAALGGTAFTLSPQGALMASNSGGGKTPAQLAEQLFSSPPSTPHGAVPNLVPPPGLIPGQINGNVLNATEQLKQLVSQQPVTMTPSKKRSNRNRRSNSSSNSNKHATPVVPGAVNHTNHVTSTANQSQQTTTTTLPLLTANQFRADGGLSTTGLKLALPLQALLPSDVSAVLTTVNGTTQEASKSPGQPKRSRPGSNAASPRKQKAPPANS